MITHKLRATIAAIQLFALPASAGVVNATYNSPTDVPVTTASYTATGNTLNITLGFTPPMGTNLTVINNTGLSFITGQFSNLAQGQVVYLSYSGQSYSFVANYYGGTGNDLVLQWGSQSLASWGYNGDGELGNGYSTNSSLPVSVTQNGVLAGKTVISVATGTYHSLALCSDGTVVAWGANSNGQLGNNSNNSSSVPVLVTQNSGALAGKTVISVAAGQYHSLALCLDGTVAAWGANNYGQLGNGPSGTGTDSWVPVLVTNTGVLSGKIVVSMAAGYSHSLALCSDGTVATWGHNNTGQLGNNSTTLRAYP